MKHQGKEFSSVFHNAPLCIMAFDKHGACISINKEGLRIMNCAEDAMIGKTFIDLWPLQYRPVIEKAVSNTISGNQAFFESSRIEGTDHRWWSVKLIPVKAEDNSDVDGFIALGSDITAEKNKEGKLEAMKLAEKKYRQYQLIFDSMQDLVHITSSYYDIEFINKACESTFGPLTSSKCYTYFHGFDAPCEWCRQDSVFSGNSHRDELYFEKTQMHFEGYYSPMVKPDGTVSKLVILRDISARKRLESDLIKAIEQKSNLVREMHHRVRNNLAMLQSLLGLQERSLSDDSARSSIIDTQSRIKVMSLVHERLYGSEDLKKLDAKEYLSTLSAKIFHTFNTRKDEIRLSLAITEAHMDIDTLVPLGLIINEMLTNTLKYAFPGDRKGQVNVALTKNGESFVLEVNDNGTGLPEGFDIESSSSLGMKIIQTLVSQIEGKLDIESGNGSAFRVAFKNTILHTYGNHSLQIMIPRNKK